MTVSNNRATEWGGGVYIEGGSLTFTSTTFGANNTANTATLGGAKIAKKNNPTITLGAGNVNLAQADIETDTR